MPCPLWSPYHQPHITCQRDSTLHGLWKEVFFQILAWIQKYNRVHSKGLTLPSTQLRLLPSRMSHIWVTSPPLMWLTEVTDHIWGWGYTCSPQHRWLVCCTFHRSSQARCLPLITLPPVFQNSCHVHLFKLFNFFKHKTCPSFYHLTPHLKPQLIS